MREEILNSYTRQLKSQLDDDLELAWDMPKVSKDVTVHDSDSEYSDSYEHNKGQGRPFVPLRDPQLMSQFRAKTQELRCKRIENRRCTELARKALQKDNALITKLEGDIRHLESVHADLCCQVLGDQKDTKLGEKALTQLSVYSGYNDAMRKTTKTTLNKSFREPV